MLSFLAVATVATLEKISLNLDNLCLAYLPSALLRYARSLSGGSSNASVVALLRLAALCLLLIRRTLFEKRGRGIANKTLAFNLA